MFRLIVLPRPVLRGLLIFHPLLNLRMGNRNDPPQKVREVLVFRIVLFGHGVIIAQLRKRREP